MMRRFLVLLLVLLLSGCGAAQPVVYERVEDVVPVSSLEDAPYEIEVQLPGDALELSRDAGGSVYEAENGAYTICTRVLVSDSLDAAVYTLSGFAQPQIRVDTADAGRQSCQFAWCSAGEEGSVVCRAKVLREGDYCYALCFNLKEGLGREYNECINEVFASFTLTQTQQLVSSGDAQVFPQGKADQIIVSDHIPPVIGI